MAVCPNGHDSASDDFCDTCGMRIGGSPPPGSPQPGSRATGSSPASGAPSSAWPDPARFRRPRPNPARAAAPRGTASSARPAATTSPAPASPPPPRPPLRRPPPARYSSEPARSRLGRLQFGPGAAPRASPAPPASSRSPGPAPRLAVDVLVSVSAGHLDRGGGRRPRLLRAGAGGHRTGRLGRHLPLLLCRTPFPARRATRCGSGGAAYRAAWPRRST